MANLTSSLGLGLSGLQASQDAMGVIGHNIANVNTPDYSRQAVVLTENPAETFGNFKFGTGVDVKGVTALRDQFLNLQLTHSLASQSGAQARYTGVQAVSSAFQDDGTTGLNTQMKQFFDSLSSLAANPEDTSLRQNVVGMSTSMLNEFKSTYHELSSQVASANQQVGALIPQINTITAQIATLNTQIGQQLDPSSDNDAIDQRQKLTDQLAGLVGIQVSSNSDNQFQITVDSGAATLVSGTTAYKLKASPSPDLGNNLQVTLSSDHSVPVDVTGKITGGTLGGNLALRDDILPGYETTMDRIAGSLAGQVNKVCADGYGLPDSKGNSVKGTLLFTSTGVPGGGPGLDPVTGQVAAIAGQPGYKGIINTLTVNPGVTGNLDLLAASGTAGVAGDNQNLLKMAALQTASGTVDSTGSGTFDTGPFSTAVSALVNSVGTQAQTFNTSATNQENLTTALQTQKSSASGVDLDQEAAQLLAYQQGYQACAQFITTISQLTNTLMTTMASR
jgi:flagellar hook-associated protein 1 FlgK